MTLWLCQTWTHSTTMLIKKWDLDQEQVLKEDLWHCFLISLQDSSPTMSTMIFQCLNLNSRSKFNCSDSNKNQEQLSNKFSNRFSKLSSIRLEPETWLCCFSSAASKYSHWFKIFQTISSSNNPFYPTNFDKINAQRRILKNTVIGPSPRQSYMRPRLGFTFPAQVHFKHKPEIRVSRQSENKTLPRKCVGFSGWYQCSSRMK